MSKSVRLLRQNFWVVFMNEAESAKKRPGMHDFFSWKAPKLIVNDKYE